MTNQELFDKLKELLESGKAKPEGSPLYMNTQWIYKDIDTVTADADGDIVFNLE
jgi:hypothetical protein